MTQTVIGEIVDIATLGAEEKELIKQAVLGRKNAYAVHSNFPVGAALRCADGTIYRGCNVENVAHTSTVCAERTVLVKAVSDGHRLFTAMAVVAEQPGHYTTPCGVCRQAIAEFTSDIPIYLSRATMDKCLVSSLTKLLPCAFRRE